MGWLKRTLVKCGLSAPLPGLPASLLPSAHNRSVRPDVKQSKPGEERWARPDGLTDEEWDIRHWAKAPRIGVACSGGGIRSASFCLGALQAVDGSADDGHGLRRVDYVSAVSGGGYTAGGWAISASRIASGSDAGPEADPPVFSPGSPEEERLRRNSSLLQNGRLVAAGLGRLTAGLAINLLLLWGVMIAVAAPVGWLLSSSMLHPELQARTPLIEIEEQPALIRNNAFLPEQDVPSFERLRDIGQVSCSSGSCPAWAVDGLQLDQPDVDAWSLTGRQLDLSGDAAPRVEFDLTHPAIVIVDGTDVRIAQQPRVAVVPGSELGSPGGSADEDVPSLSVERQPQLTATGEPAAMPDAVSLTIADDPHLAQRSGTTGRPPLEHSWWMAPTTALSLFIAILVGLGRIVLRPTTEVSTSGWRWAVRISSGVALLAALLLYALPLLIVTVPSAIASIPSWVPFLGGDQITDSALVNTTAFAFFLTVIQTGIRLLRQPAEAAARKWPLQAAQVVVMLLLVAVIVAVFVDILEIASANGPWGHLSDFAFYPTFRIDVGEQYLSLPDFWRWLLVLLLLAAWATLADAHAWSLFPFYKRWLNRAFVSQRSTPVLPDFSVFPGAPTPAEEGSYRDEMKWPTFGRLAPVAKDADAESGPRLLLCCAVNLNGPGEAATSRNAGSFVFSTDYIGGPDVGWISTADYLERLPKSRKKDVTVLATMAISGAAFSPGMGKKSMGAIGGLLAIVNARLGVWLPHPRAVGEIPDEKTWPGLWRRPGWTWWGREVIRRFRSDDSYLYISDGGHWENLGVVELLRRGCNHVYVVSAAGDGQQGFGTIGEAIALAREELGIEIEGLDLNRMRPPVEEASDGGGVFRYADGSTGRFAAATYVVGTLRRVGEKEAYGNIIALEANLTQGMPWDVRTHAENNPQFPDDTTLDQFFDHRQFESYRRLGHDQMNDALDAVPLPSGASRVART